MFKSTSTGKRGEREKGGKEKKTTTFQWGWIASGRGRKTSAGRTGRGEWALHRFKVLYQSSFAWRGGACHPRMSLKPNQSKILHDLEMVDLPAKFSSGKSELKSLLIPAKGLLNGAPRMTGKGPVLTTGLSSGTIGFATPAHFSFASSSATPGHVW